MSRKCAAFSRTWVAIVQSSLISQLLCLSLVLPQDLTGLDGGWLNVGGARGMPCSPVDVPQPCEAPRLCLTPGYWEGEAVTGVSSLCFSLSTRVQPASQLVCPGRCSLR